MSIMSLDSFYVDRPIAFNWFLLIGKTHFERFLFPPKKNGFIFHNTSYLHELSLFKGGSKQFGKKNLTKWLNMSSVHPSTNLMWIQNFNLFAKKKHSKRSFKPWPRSGYLTQIARNFSIFWKKWIWSPKLEI